jgi:hypothetical protein
MAICKDINTGIFRIKKDGALDKSRLTGSGRGTGRGESMRDCADSTRDCALKVADNEPPDVGGRRLST